MRARVRVQVPPASGEPVRPCQQGADPAMASATDAGSCRSSERPAGGRADVAGRLAAARVASGAAEHPTAGREVWRPVAAGRETWLRAASSRAASVPVHGADQAAASWGRPGPEAAAQAELARPRRVGCRWAARQARRQVAPFVARRSWQTQRSLQAPGFEVGSDDRAAQDVVPEQPPGKGQDVIGGHGS